MSVDILICAVGSEFRCSSSLFSLVSLFSLLLHLLQFAKKKRYEKMCHAEKRSEALNSSASPRLRVSPLLPVGFEIVSYYRPLAITAGLAWLGPPY